MVQEAAERRIAVRGADAVGPLRERLVRIRVDENLLEVAPVSPDDVGVARRGERTLDVDRPAYPRIEDKEVGTGPRAVDVFGSLGHEHVLEVEDLLLSRTGEGILLLRARDHVRSEQMRDHAARTGLPLVERAGQLVACRARHAVFVAPLLLAVAAHERDGRLRRRDVGRIPVRRPLAAHRNLRADRVVGERRAIAVHGEVVEARFLRHARGEGDRADAGGHARVLVERHVALSAPFQLQRDLLVRRRHRGGPAHAADPLAMAHAPVVLRREEPVLRILGRVERRVEREFLEVVRVEVLRPVRIGIPLRRPVRHLRRELLLRVGDARRRGAVRGVLLVVLRITAIAHERIRPGVEVLVGAVAHAVAQEVVVELDDEVRARTVERDRDIVAIALARHGGVRQIGHRAQVAPPDIRRGRVLERIVRVLEELLALEVEPQRFAHRVRRHVVAVPPRVRADQLHANVFALHALRPVRRHARAELHPLARALRLADAHEVVVPARRRLVDVVRAVDYIRNLFRPSSEKWILGTASGVINGDIMRRTLLRNEIILKVSDTNWKG